MDVGSLNAYSDSNNNGHLAVVVMVVAEGVNLSRPDIARESEAWGTAEAQSNGGCHYFTLVSGRSHLSDSLSNVYILIFGHAVH